MKRGYARGEARNEAIRQELEPLAPGERPRAITAAAIVALLLAAGNVVLFLVGYEVRGQQPTTSGTAIFALILVGAAVGMWLRRYWAVLGFQALLAITVTYAFLGLLRAGNLRAVVLTLAVILAAGTLFWFLVKAMARIQMPQRPTRSS